MDSENSRTLIKHDISSIHKFLQTFDKALTRAVCAMKAMGDSLEGLSLEFNKISQLQFVDDSFKAETRQFSEILKHFRDGQSFMRYNDQLHRDVRTPLVNLAKMLQKTERIEKSRSVALQNFRKAQSKVQKKEKKYLKRSKALSTSTKYDTLVHQSEKRLIAYDTCQLEANASFDLLLKETQSNARGMLESCAKHTSMYLADLTVALQRLSSGAEYAKCRGRRSVSPFLSTPLRAEGMHRPSPTKLSDGPRTPYVKASGSAGAHFRHDTEKSPTPFCTNAPNQWNGARDFYHDPCRALSMDWERSQNGGNGKKRDSIESCTSNATHAHSGHGNGRQPSFLDNNLYNNFAPSVSGCGGTNGGDGRGPMPFAWKAEDLRGCSAVPV